MAMTKARTRGLQPLNVPVECEYRSKLTQFQRDTGKGEVLGEVKKVKVHLWHATFERLYGPHRLHRLTQLNALVSRYLQLRSSMEALNVNM